MKAYDRKVVASRLNGWVLVVVCFSLLLLYTLCSSRDDIIRQEISNTTSMTLSCRLRTELEFACTAQEWCAVWSLGSKCRVVVVSCCTWCSPMLGLHACTDGRYCWRRWIYYILIHLDLRHSPQPSIYTAAIAIPKSNHRDLVYPRGLDGLGILHLAPRHLIHD